MHILKDNGVLMCNKFPVCVMKSVGREVKDTDANTEFITEVSPFHLHLFKICMPSVLAATKETNI